MNLLARTLTAFIEALPDPEFQDESAIAEIQTTVTRMSYAINGGCYMPCPPDVRIYVRPDKTYYWALAYANGLTFHHTCTFRLRDQSTCTDDATEMVGPESMCAEHAVARRAENARHDAAMRAFAESPEGIEEARREMAWEARVS